MWSSAQTAKETLHIITTALTQAKNEETRVVGDVKFFENVSTECRPVFAKSLAATTY